MSDTLTETINIQEGYTRDSGYYRCIHCTYKTKYKNVIINHLEKINKCYIKKIIKCEYCHKEFKNNQDKERHDNRKYKCYDNNNNNNIHELIYVSQTSSELEIDIVDKNNIDSLKKELEEAKAEIQRLKDNNIQNDKILHDSYSDELVDKYKRKNNPKDYDTVYKYFLETRILWKSLFEHKIGRAHV